MRFRWGAFGVGLSLCVLLAGCPISENGAGGVVPGGSQNTGVAGTGATGSQGAAGSSFADSLTAAFPGCNEPVSASSWRAEVLSLVNRERSSRGLNALARNQTLENQATQYACEMISGDFFAHVNPVTGSTLADRAQEFEYDYRVIGENLAAGQTGPTQVFTDWMNSPGHRENILDPRFTELGIAVRAGGSYGFYWVQEFGQPAAGASASP